MACGNMLLCLVAVISVNVISAAVNVTHVKTVYLPYNVTSAGTQLFNLSSDAVEMVSYDPKEKIIYAAGFGVLHVIDCIDPNNMKVLYSKFVNGLDFTDIEVCDDFVFVSADNNITRMEGQLQVYKKHVRTGNSELQLLKSVIVGPQPDNVYPRPGCKSVLVALEAEGFTAPSGKFIDPEGAVVIVSWPNGPQTDAQTVKTLDFKSFNSKVGELEATGVRYVYRENNTFSADIEPEFIALDEDGKKAYVCLQENNGIAVVDLATETITNIHGLGYKQWGVFDASDRDNGIQMSYWPIRAWYQPDMIQFVNWKGRKLVFTANEGDMKRYPGFKEVQRGKQFTDLGDGMPAVVKTWLQNDQQLGRLKLSKIDGKDKNGQYQNLYAYGGRSFSIRDADDSLKLLYDSDNDIERITALTYPHAFNTEGEKVDEKSDSKGPETESLALGQVGNRLYAFIGNENPGSIFIYSIGDDVTKPRFETMFVGGLPDNSKTLQEKYDAREVYALDAEDIKFVSAADSPIAGVPILIVSGTESGTVSILRLDITDDAAVGPQVPASVVVGTEAKP